MILSFYKSIKLIIVFTLLANFCFAQSNYFKYAYGAGIGLNKSYTDVYKGGIGFTASGYFDYRITPYVTIGAEAQVGRVKGGSITQDPNNRQFANSYTGLSINSKVMLGELVYYDDSEFLYNLRGLYFGLGIGAINNKITDIVRFRPPFSNDPGYGPFPGKDKSVNLWVPISIGYNLFITDSYGYQRYIIGFNAQSNFTFGEGLDGYNDPSSKFKNNDPDVYNVYSISIKYLFGTIKSYRKTL